MNILLLDRDGTLNVDTGEILKPSAMRLAPGAAEGLRKFCDARYRLFILTNQSALGEGKDTEENFAATHRRLLELLQEHGITVEATYHCPHAKNAACECRKPKLGLWQALKKDHPEVEPGACIFIGDKDIDVALGKTIGCRTARIFSRYETKEKADFDIESIDALAAILLKP